MTYLLFAALLVSLPWVLECVFTEGDGGSGDSDTEDDEAEPPRDDPEDPGQGGGNDGVQVTGTSLDDFIRTYGGDDAIVGLEGNDSLYGGAGDDGLQGDAGNDQLHGGLDDDALSGGDGSDALFGGFGDDVLSGGAEDDTLEGGSGRDGLYGDAGDDELDGGSGEDFLAGDAGIDTLRGGDGDDQLFDTQGFGSGSFEPSRMEGGAGDDQLVFDQGSTVSGGPGADALFMNGTPNGDPTEILEFSPGEDRLEIFLPVTDSEGGEITLVDWADGTGADLYVDGALLAEIAGGQDLTAGDLVLRQELPGDGSINSYSDGPAASILSGNNFDNTVLGNAGDDHIIVGRDSGSQSIADQSQNLADGGEGDDTLQGNGGGGYDYDGLPFELTAPDTLIGGAGDDVLLSYNGNEMTGGSGEDLFALAPDLPHVAEGFTLSPSTISDFDADEDTLVVLVNPLTLTADAPGVVTVEPWGDGLGADVLLDGTLIAEVAGGQALTPAMISVETGGTAALGIA